MENHDKEFEELLISRVTDSVEAKIAGQESRRFRTLYVIIGLVSFVGIGVVAQLVDFYATKAVETKLHEATQELNSAKTFAQLMSLATKLDLSDSFTHTDRDTVITLLESAKDNPKLRSEPAFESLLEKIVDSFSASDNPMHVSKIVDMYNDECFLNPGIALTLLIHYGRSYLANTDINSKIAKDDYDKLSKAINALSGERKGITSAFAVLSEFKKNGEKGNEAIKSILDSLESLSDEDKKHFVLAIEESSDPSQMAKRPTPEILRVAKVTNGFINVYKKELSTIAQSQSISVN